MENFFLDDLFCSDMSDLFSHLDIHEDNINDLPDDYKCEVQCTDLKPILKLDAEWIAERMDDDCFSEDGCDSELAKVVKVLKENIDFEKINALMPKLYYGNGMTHCFTKADFLKEI